MKKIVKVSLVILVMFFVNKTEAQKIDWGVLEESSRNYFPTIIGEDESNFYTFGALKKDFIIERYDKTKKKQQFKKIIEEIKISGNKTRIEGVSFMDGKFIVLVSYFDKKSKKSKIFAYSLDAETGKSKSKDVELFEVPTSKKRFDFDISITEDLSKMLVVHQSYNKKQKKYKVKYKLIDSDMKELAYREDVYGYNTRKIGRASLRSKYTLDNDGSVYFFNGSGIVIYDANSNFEKWEQKLDFLNLGLDAGSGITNMKMNINSKNDLIITGYYTKAKNDFDGCFFAKVDSKSKELITSKVTEFTDEFKNQFRTKRQEKKGKEAKLKAVFDKIQIIDKEDGGIVLIGELFIEHEFYNREGQKTGGYEFYLDLVVLNLSPKGDLLWANRVPKKQKYTYKTTIAGQISIGGFARIAEYFSYVAAIGPNEVYIMFNDNPANTESNDDQNRDKALRSLDKSVVNMFSLDLESGDKKEGLFFNAKSQEVFLNTTVFYQKNESTSPITFARKGSKYRYGIFTM